MGFFKNLFKSEQEYEENLRKQTIENQVKIWEIQSRMGKTPDVQADMEKIYGLDKLEQKQREKQQTKEIIKGAVVGGIVAGDAGAVVGAMAAKNKIDSRNANSSPNTQRPSTPAYTPSVPVATQTPQYNHVESRERVAQVQNNDMPAQLKYHHSPEWNIRYKRLKNDPNANTGNLAQDVEYCISKLEVIIGRDIMEILDNSFSRIRPAITPLMNANKVERIEYNGTPYFVWKQSKNANSMNIDEATILNFYGSTKWNNIKSALISEGIVKTGNSQTDVLYCLNQLAVAKCSDLCDILDEDVIKVRPMLTPLMNNDVVKRVEHQGAVVFFITDKSTQNQVINSPFAPVQTNNNKFDEVKKFKELLDSGIITQEEFNAKKKELLGL